MVSVDQEFGSGLAVLFCLKICSEVGYCLKAWRSASRVGQSCSCWLKASVCLHKDLSTGLLSVPLPWSLTFSRTCSPRHRGGSMNAVHVLALEVIHHHFLNILLVTQSQPYSVWEGLQKGTNEVRVTGGHFGGYNNSFNCCLEVYMSFLYRWFLLSLSGFLPDILFVVDILQFYYNMSRCRICCASYTCEFIFFITSGKFS